MKSPLPSPTAPAGNAQHQPTRWLMRHIWWLVPLVLVLSAATEVIRRQLWPPDWLYDFKVEILPSQKK